ncbi:MAG: hypothetical protein F6K35_12660 [Okeania sp. SIO2H7]|nr:hypothetical protein [Okeania sp. SIO2H7]
MTKTGKHDRHSKFGLQILVSVLVAIAPLDEAIATNNKPIFYLVSKCSAGIFCPISVSYWWASF